MQPCQPQFTYFIQRLLTHNSLVTFCTIKGYLLELLKYLPLLEYKRNLAIISSHIFLSVILHHCCLFLLRFCLMLLYRITLPFVAEWEWEFDAEELICGKSMT